MTMNANRESLASAAYALFALQQPVSLTTIAEGAQDRTFPLAVSQSPEWFAAASDAESSLLEMAPELLVLPMDAEDVDVTGIDLIHVYAPELSSIEDLDDEPEPVAEEAPTKQTPGTATQLGLLKELGNLDG